ncbi:MAG TPA: hypothetical protein VFM05_12025 [Candidatus Saccharimonadales bacterium]|nr:hypothetical protein [Candidatus Saccharimonadales bacterium]
MRDWRRELATVGVSLVVLCLWAGPIAHAQSSSANYQVEEAFFGSGGELDASSNSYKAKQAAGELTVGNSASTNYQFQGGFNTSDIPLLELAVSGGTYDMGVLDYGTTGAVQASFTVRNYLSSGYIIVLNGNAPTLPDGGHTLAPMSALAQSSPGTEQFGVNLVDNGNPDIGANPVQVPDATFSFGTAVTGYDTPNWFRFADGGTIGMSPKSSGQTNYTLSMIANIARETPAGQYGGSLSVQVVPTF